jgi:Zn-dependent peptidase ImmA (M78 family)
MKMIPNEYLSKISSFQREAPIPIAKVAESFGLKIFQQEFPKGISGKIWKNDASDTKSGFVIFVNKNEPHVRQRFTAAHEIGHFVLHQNVIGNGIEENYMLRAEGISSKYEVEANAFAAELLMPFPLIEKLVNEGCNEVSALAKKLQVSEIAMAIRLGYPT